MTVYVDDARHPFYCGRGKAMLMSHLMADTETELHAFASRLGLMRRWYQGDHYDVCQSKRQSALANGAIGVTERQLAAMRSNRWRTGSLGNPQTAIEDMLARKRETT